MSETVMRSCSMPTEKRLTTFNLWFVNFHLDVVDTAVLDEVDFFLCLGVFDHTSALSDPYVVPIINEAPD